jgi:hypothetical protein
MNGLKILLGFPVILEEWKSQILDALLIFEFVSHLEFGCLGAAQV